jgi:peptidoglycan-N-acetylglucosamine deacetylase
MNILTFDVEEWFHILDNESTNSELSWSKREYRLESNMDRIFELLERKNQKATFFVLGWVSRKFPLVLKRIQQAGYEIATHSDNHQLAYKQSREEFKSDLDRSIKSIEDVIGVKVDTYRAPGFSIMEKNKWVFEELVNQGIKIDCSIFPAGRSHGGFQSYGHAEPSIIDLGDKVIKEFPINIYTIAGLNVIFSGGGYFRLLPYWFIKTMMKRSDYVMTYFHPRDFDKNQPMVEGLSYLRRFKSYYGLSSAYAKLEELIDDFEFVDLKDAVKSVDWDKAKKIII